MDEPMGLSVHIFTESSVAAATNSIHYYRHPRFRGDDQ